MISSLIEWDEEGKNDYVVATVAQLLLSPILSVDRRPGSDVPNLRHKINLSILFRAKRGAEEKVLKCSDRTHLID